MQKLAYAIIPLVFLVAVPAWFAGSNPENSATTAPNSIDSLNFKAYSEGINTVLYDLDGQINYTLRAQSQTQFVDETTEVENPYIRLFQEGVPAWNVIADTGVISAQNSTTMNNENSRTIELTGNVEVFSVDQIGNRTVILTERLIVNPMSETLTTQSPVELQTETIRQTAIGMFADLKIDEIVFQSDIRGVYEHKQAQ